MCRTETLIQSEGDLTVLVGKQATGKTLFLEMLKLAVDTGYIQSELTSHGFDWGKKKETFFDLYLGEGMRSVLQEASRIVIDGKPHRLECIGRINALLAISSH